MLLVEYIAKHYEGVQVRYAKDKGYPQSRVSEWVAKGNVHVDDKGNAFTYKSKIKKDKDNAK